jgi:deoxyribonuclease V
MTMMVCLDVDYRELVTVSACVGFESWDASVALFETTHRSAKASPYQPGKFYLRELPCLLAALDDLPERPSLIVVDGYVWLGPESKGLGAHLFDALGGAIPVVGVAKNRFRSASGAIEVMRGSSKRPLYVSSIGMDAHEAALGVANMAGEHRIPTMLKRVDRVCRDGSRSRLL